MVVPLSLVALTRVVKHMLIKTLMQKITPASCLQKTREIWANVFGRSINRPVPEPRTTWADETEVKLTAIRKKRYDLVSVLDKEEALAKARCNHTLKDGTSLLEVGYDDEYNHTWQTCKICGGGGV